jgi:NAD+ kinase
MFPEDSLDMGYIVREPIINETFGDIRFRKYVAEPAERRAGG